MNSIFRAIKTVLIAVPCVAVLFLVACGGGGGGGSTTPAPTTFSISGTLAGAANVTVTLSGAATMTTTTDANGNYSFTGLANGSYTVTPPYTAYIFSPTSTAVNVNGANVTGKNSSATASTAATYCLSGTVSGAVKQNVTVFLNGTTTGSTVTDANGNYAFCGLVNGTYTVTAFLQGYSITTSSTITISNANPASVNLTSTIAATGSSVVFVPLNPLPQATVGTAYSNTVISGIAGGTPPYHYQSDTFANGAPPMGMIVGLDGNLSGIPRVADIYTFGVCAVDLGGFSSCRAISINVNSMLTVSLAGNGSGTVTSSSGGINCGATCSAGFAGGTVTLTATPSTGSTFTGWSGACTGTGSCVVSMNANKTVAATFSSTTAASNDGTWNLQVAITTCYAFTQTTPITITNGKFSGHLFQYCSDAKTGTTWLGGSGCGGSAGQYWIGTQDVSVDLTVTGNSISGNLTLTGSSCNGSNGFSGIFDTATHGSAGSYWGTLTFNK